MNEHYMAVLADLKQMKSDAEAGIHAIERLISRNGTSSVQDAIGLADSVSHTVRPDREGPSDSVSVPQRVLTFLKNSPGQTFTTEEIGNGIGGVRIHTLRGALGRLYKTKKIGKYGRGRYRFNRAGGRVGATPGEQTAAEES